MTALDFLAPSDVALSGGACPDPLDRDLPGDDVVVTTRRGITRVALVATETGGRFQREGVAHDPMAWMLAPRRLFGGASAIDACLDRDACLRGVLLHGLSLGLDAEAVDVDALVADEDDAGRDDDDGRVGNTSAHDGPGDGGGGPPPMDGDGEAGGLCLFTATVVASDGFERVHAFHASLAHDRADVAGRLYMRMGAAMADARIMEGFDPSDPLVVAMVAPALCDTLSLIADDPSSPLAAGLDLNVEQRFLN